MTIIAVALYVYILVMKYSFHGISWMLHNTFYKSSPQLSTKIKIPIHVFPFSCEMLLTIYTFPSHSHWITKPVRPNYNLMSEHIYKHQTPRKSHGSNKDKSCNVSLYNFNDRANLNIKKEHTWQRC